MSTGPKILLVEDDVLLLELLQMKLRDTFAIETAINGVEALQKAKTISPDLIVLDIMMPDIDGLEVCRELKSAPATQDIPVIFLTARGTDADREKGLKYGAAAYIDKPFDFDHLKKTITGILNRSSPR